ASVVLNSTLNFSTLNRLNPYLLGRDCCTSKRNVFLNQKVDFSYVSPSFHQNHLKLKAPRVPRCTAYPTKNLGQISRITPRPARENLPSSPRIRVHWCAFVVALLGGLVFLVAPSFQPRLSDLQSIFHLFFTSPFESRTSNLFSSLGGLCGRCVSKISK